MTEERAYWLAWASINGLGPIALQKLKQKFNTLAIAWTSTPKELGQISGFGPHTIEKIVEERSRINPEQLLKQHIEKNPNFWTPADPDYPRLLQEIPTPPPLLYYRGIVDFQEILGITPTVGIVGTRNPSEYGRRWTRKISSILAKSGFTIVSGLAAGIDTEAHSACLEVGGRTVAVFGNGVDIVYPRENKSLAEQVVKQGLAVSEYPAGTKPNSKHFPQRNRIIAGLSRAVLIMEAPQKSGALITADMANEFCRDVYVLPARLDDQKSYGCLQLINKGAEVIPITMDRLLEMLGAMPSLDIDVEEYSEKLSLFNDKNQTYMPNLEPMLAEIFKHISTEPIVLDLIIQKTGLSSGEVSSSLLQLELLGLVTQLPGMRYQKN
ncbi:MAG: DNA-processing protein DprA [Trichodesmium sp. St2_bin6]|nr:DNA-processing protein DprA [Trichodesmium sp. MAG_R01]MDE5069379.1 DNA-processing protein DprA [Trichodesmium sp. St4_bin8_1]MDE5073748.1 DNA-processing protein DprA [Trichodesmium sp. St5_bin8]MDE5079657.1 DNA-processing protein DprA [Trichodesmium sp. St2_bin6]MDE5091294.1 DNA-processing protein DprA [Trichodesmium sp. St18_bin3_1_1]MDE5103376.1 DNA-processing protein DprA [Trichodesmium sp. St19_bin2]